MADKSIKISEETYDKLLKAKYRTRMAIKWLVDRAVEIMLKKERG